MASPSAPASERLSAFLRMAVFVWAAAITIPLTLFTARHALALPASGNGKVPVEPTGDWQAVHVLAPDCPCSALIAEYLIQRRKDPGLQETAIILGDDPDWAARLQAAGFTINPFDPEKMTALTGIQGAPWLMLVRGDGAVAYSGGYAPRKPRNSSEIRDLALWHSVREGAPIPSHPAFGCATSSALQRLFDPTLVVNASASSRPKP